MYLILRKRAYKSFYHLTKKTKINIRIIIFTTSVKSFRTYFRNCQKHKSVVCDNKNFKNIEI